VTSSSFDLFGIVPPVSTPFTESHDVDIPSLERLIKFQLDAGVHGLFMLGSTSETAVLTSSQRTQVVETAARIAKGKVPIMAGTMDMSTDRIIENGLAAKKAGAEALVVTCPYYIKPGQGEIIEHFRMVKEAVDLPIVAYDIPFAVQTKLATNTVMTLAREGTIVGIKDSSGDDGTFRAWMIEARTIPGFRALTGSELIVDGMLMMGAAGAVPGLCNVDPHGFVKIWNAVAAGDYKTATAEQDRLVKLFNIVSVGDSNRIGHTASALGGFKTVLKLRGIIDTNVMGRPMGQLNDAEVAKVRSIVVEAGLLDA
jgi:4-hydroxy-tetrahydrodipicolinate synthase